MSANPTSVGQTNASSEGRSHSDSRSMSADKIDVSSKRVISFGCVEIHEDEMTEGNPAKYDDTAPGSASHKRKRRARTCRKCDSIVDEHCVVLMRETHRRRDACKLAIRCGCDASPSWSIVWDNAGPAHIYVPRSRRDVEQRHMPLKSGVRLSLAQVSP